MSDLRVVCLGGGLGAPMVMAGLRKHTDRITALIGVTDSGRSTGEGPHRARRPGAWRHP